MAQHGEFAQFFELKRLSFTTPDRADDVVRGGAGLPDGELCRGGTDAAIRHRDESAIAQRPDVVCSRLSWPL